ncbi:hypothetical protein P43SY_000162 [Pythium insidiosum]|uniref:Transmembrane protein n=1 Tax=Pythium insidiosum TaxID=114742 RepID=A0AAD5LXS3_PYTIN|nr:hypothetical protein P43SY_000162 [Pythium insidiosum]
MMDMQEIKERKPHNAHQEPSDRQHEEEVDPEVPVSTPLMASGAAARRQRSSLEVGIKFVTDRFWPTVFFTVAAVGLYEARFVQRVLYSDHANRLFVNLFIFCASMVMLFGSYIELYRNFFLGEKVTYEKAKTSTHGMLLFMFLAGVCFCIGMWPVWHWLTLPYLFMWFWGVIVQIVVIFPVQLQRVIFMVAYLWFMHSYLSLFVV